MKTLRPGTLLGIAILLAGCATSSSSDDYAERMAREHADETPEASAPEAAPASEVTGEEVVYGMVNGEPLRGYLARPAGAADRLPGLLVIHPNAGHAFANPSGEWYQAAAAEDAWRRTTVFLAEHLKEDGS